MIYFKKDAIARIREYCRRKLDNMLSERLNLEPKVRLEILRLKKLAFIRKNY